ncbi:ribosome-associated heat shock protein Hsp15 [Catenovulum sediminis]|uniref:ribosome-associated heat shock protein Hsp15 n=1 Tax=Catenovulum sediminis TaxID=1740262 RepID=UPI001180E41B|nr:ribosome-associated heat shock protein Hsp15 [Catenovulum sediminis]
MNAKSSQRKNEVTSVRIDKWLWAARFFKTRVLARGAIESGKVKYNGQRCKPSRNLEVGAKLTIQQGFDEKQINILGLAEQRLSAPLAQALYQETAESIKKRTELAEMRKLQHSLNPKPDTKPDKKQRRQLIQVKHFNE